MARAEVLYDPDPPVVGVKLLLIPAEVDALRAVLERIGGSGSGPRRHLSNILEALELEGLPYTGDDRYIFTYPETFTEIALYIEEA